MQANLAVVGRVLGLVTYLSSFGRRSLLETIPLLTACRTSRMHQQALTFC
jgi:hypothetical protein